ncbi:MAG: hypothetical protein WBR33_10290 [Pseudonocardiaceae bacterium]
MALSTNAIASATSTPFSRGGCSGQPRSSVPGGSPELAGPLAPRLRSEHRSPLLVSAGDRGLDDREHADTGQLGELVFFGCYA